jgi:hypothetical protein
MARLRNALMTAAMAAPIAPRERPWPDRRLERRPDRRPEAGARGHADAPQRPPADQVAGHAGGHDRPAVVDLDHAVRRADPARGRGRAADGRLLPHLPGRARPAAPRPAAPRPARSWSGPAASRGPSRRPSRSSRACSPVAASRSPIPTTEDNDPVFHPAEGIDGDIALKAAQRVKPGVHARRASMPGTSRCCNGCWAAIQATKAGCGIAKPSSELKGNKGDSPDLEGALSIASTAARPCCWNMSRASRWPGRLGPRLQGRHPRHAALPSGEVPLRGRLALYRRALRRADRQAVLAALNGEADTGGKLTLLVGHDTNIAALRGFLRRPLHRADYPRDDPPPGGAMGFELLKDAAATPSCAPSTRPRAWTSCASCSR